MGRVGNFVTGVLDLRKPAESDGTQSMKGAGIAMGWERVDVGIFVVVELYHYVVGV